MKEVVSIHIGQAGSQVANAAWELFCVEHGIDCRGTQVKDMGDDTTFHTFYEHTPKKQYVPRAIMVDLEPTVLDEVRTGQYRQLFHPDRLITGYEDAANNFARGHFTVGRALIDKTTDQIRKIVENCECLQGFFVTNSCGGGTGSGFVALLFENLSMEYGKRPKIQTAIFPGATLSTAIVEPYNSVLSMHSTMDHTDVSFLYDNESLFNISKRSLDVGRPNYNYINRLTAKVLSSMTVSMRFEGPLHADFAQIQTNLIPYPRIHFPIISHAPLLSVDRAEHQQLTSNELTRMVFDEKNQMVSCNVHEGRYMSCCLQYRGDMNMHKIYKTLTDVKKLKEIQFVDWCPTGFKVGLNRAKPCALPGFDVAAVSSCVTLMCNSTSINQTFRRLGSKFDLMFAKRAFVHHYVGEGMEEGELSEARDDITTLIKDYEEAAELTGGGTAEAADIDENFSSQNNLNIEEDNVGYEEIQHHSSPQKEATPEYNYNPPDEVEAPVEEPELGDENMNDPAEFM